MNGSRPAKNESPPSTEDSSESSAPSSSDPSATGADPLAQLDELLDSENFDDERTSVIIVDRKETPSARPSLIKSLGKKHPRAALVVSLVLTSAIWAKVLIDLVEALR
jgi:hypothetical protein